MRDSQIVKVAKALADPTRLKMLHEIREAGTLNCSQVCEKFTQSQPTISHHIKTLESSGLINIARRGQFHELSVNEDVLKAFTATLNGVSAPHVAGAEAAPKRKRASAGVDGE